MMQTSSQGELWKSYCVQHDLMLLLWVSYVFIREQNHIVKQSLSYWTPTKPSFWKRSQNYLIRSRKQRKQLLNTTSQNCIALISLLQAGFSKHIMKLQVDVMGTWRNTNLDVINTSVLGGCSGGVSAEGQHTQAFCIHTNLSLSIATVCKKNQKIGRGKIIVLDVEKLPQNHLTDKNKQKFIWDMQQSLTCNKREENQVSKFKIILCGNSSSNRKFWRAVLKADYGQKE